MATSGVTHTMTGNGKWMPGRPSQEKAKDMKNYTEQELAELSSAIIKRTRATMHPMNDLENRFVNSWRNGVSFEERKEMADAIRTKTFNDITAFVKSQDADDARTRNKSVDDFVNALQGRTGSPGGAGSLGAALKSEGFDRKTRPTVDIAFEAATGYALGKASIDGGTDMTDVTPLRVTQPALGAEERFIFPAFPSQAIDFSQSSVNSWRQKSRNTGTPADDVRAFLATSTKPSVGTVFEVVSQDTNQVAWTEPGTRTPSSR